jgi:hypothetical protein
MTVTRVFDRVAETDARSDAYRMRLLWNGATPDINTKVWDLNTWLDQGREGACVGFGFSHEAAAAPEKVTGITNETARQWYFDAQRDDYWAGGAYPGASPVYEGTSTLAGAKVGVRYGHYTSYLWAKTEDEIARTVSNFGPVAIGVNWYEGMMDPDARGILWPAGDMVGGHCTLIIGIIMPNQPLPSDWDYLTPEEIGTGLYVIHNSWGLGWGLNGRALIARENIDRLLHEDGDACVLTRTHIDPEPVKPEPVLTQCGFFTKFINWLSGGKFECPRKGFKNGK